MKLSIDRMILGGCLLIVMNKCKNEGAWMKRLIFVFMTAVLFACDYSGEAVTNAIIEDDLGRLKSLLQDGEELNEKDIYWGVRNNSWKTLKYVFDNAIYDINKPDRHGYTILSDAVLSEDLGAVEQLLLFGADPNVLQADGGYVLHYIFRYSYCDKERVDEYSDCIEEKRFDAAKLLIGAGANVNFLDSSGFSPLSMAVLYDDEALVGLFIDHGAAPDCFGPESYSPLVFAKRPEMVALLLGAGASVNAANADGRTALDYLMDKLKSGRPDLSATEADKEMLENERIINELKLYGAKSGKSVKNVFSGKCE